LITLLFVIAAVEGFWPRVSISSKDPVNTSLPFSVSFTLTNTGFVTLYDAGVRIALGEIVAEPQSFNPPQHFELGSGGFTRPEWQHHILTRDEPWTISTENMFGLALNAVLSGADFAIVIRYKLRFWPWYNDNAFRFVTHRSDNGQLYWYSAPLE